jgi:hypothetical protein
LNACFQLDMLAFGLEANVSDLLHLGWRKS